MYKYDSEGLYEADEGRVRETLRHEYPEVSSYYKVKICLDIVHVLI